MNEGTQNLDGGRSFEERVFARFDAFDARFDGIDARFDGIDARFDGVDARFDGVDARFDGVDARFDTVDLAISNLGTRVQNLETRADETNSRLEKLELRSYDTKPIWEQALKEIVQTRRELSKRLDRVESVVYEIRAELGDHEDRLEKLEAKPGE